jgi:hypothetical protein
MILSCINHVRFGTLPPRYSGVLLVDGAIAVLSGSTTSRNYITRQSFDVPDTDLYQTIKINTVVINSRNVVDNPAGLGFESILKRGGWKSDRRPGTIRVPL